MSRHRWCRSPPSGSAAATAPPVAGEPVPSPAGASSDRRDSRGREEVRGHVRALRSPRRLTGRLCLTFVPLRRMTGLGEAGSCTGAARRSRLRRRWLRRHEEVRRQRGHELPGDEDRERIWKHDHSRRVNGHDPEREDGHEDQVHGMGWSRRQGPASWERSKRGRRSGHCELDRAFLVTVNAVDTSGERVDHGRMRFVLTLGAAVASLVGRSGWVARQGTCRSAAPVF